MNSHDDPSAIRSGRAPLEPSDRDLWLSSDIDGVAASGGLALDTTSTDDAARRALFVASATLIGHVAPVDEVTMARLIRTAIQSREVVDAQIHGERDVDAASDIVPMSARRAIASSWLVPVGAVAAALTLVAGIAMAVRINGLTDKDGPLADSAQVPKMLTLDADSGLVDLGDLSIPGALQQLSQQRSATMAAESEAGSSNMYDSSMSARSSVATADASGESPSPGQACVGGLNPGGVTPTVVGFGTHNGVAALVATAAESDATLAFIFDPADCSIRSFTRFTNS